MNDERQVAIITGANSGIGLALASKLLTSCPRLLICMACRNRSKAESARCNLMNSFPDAEIEIFLMDVAHVETVYSAAMEIKKRFRHIDYIFLNAGIMPVSTVDWSNFWKQLFSNNCFHMFLTGDGLLKQVDAKTNDGFSEIFATNLFGHFVLVKELEDILGGDLETQIIWTSSSNAKREAFSIENIQHVNGHEPYASSKYAVDLISYQINQRLNHKKIYSHTTCPGLVMTNLTYGILPSWVWFLLLPVLMLLRLFIPSMTVSPENGCSVLFWLTRQNPPTLDPKSKFYSRTSFLGKQYTEIKQMDLNPELAKETYERLTELEVEYRQSNKIMKKHL